MHDGAVGARWVQALATRGVDISISWVAVHLRIALMALGTLSALVFLLRPSWERTGDAGRDP